NLTRANPLFIPLCALRAGAVLAFARRPDRRAWVFLLLFAGYSAVAVVSSHREALRLDALLGTHLAGRLDAWLPLPMLAPAAALALLNPCGRARPGGLAGCGSDLRGLRLLHLGYDAIGRCADPARRAPCAHRLRRR